MVGAFVAEKDYSGHVAYRWGALRRPETMVLFALMAEAHYYSTRAIRCLHTIRSVLVQQDRAAHSAIGVAQPATRIELLRNACGITPFSRKRATRFEIPLFWTHPFLIRGILPVLYLSCDRDTIRTSYSWILGIRIKGQTEQYLLFTIRAAVRGLSGNRSRVCELLFVVLDCVLLSLTIYLGS